MAELEIGLLLRKYLDLKIGSEVEGKREVEEYLVAKNGSPQRINEQFTNEKARIKLKSIDQKKWWSLADSNR